MSIKNFLYYWHLTGLKKTSHFRTHFFQKKEKNIFSPLQNIMSSEITWHESQTGVLSYIIATYSIHVQVAHLRLIARTILSELVQLKDTCYCASQPGVMCISDGRSLKYHSETFHGSKIIKHSNYDTV